MTGSFIRIEAQKEFHVKTQKHTESRGHLKGGTKIEMMPPQPKEWGHWTLGIGKERFLPCRVQTECGPS